MAPSIFDMHDVLFDDSSCYRYLLEKNVFYRTLPCTVCGGDMARDIEQKAFRWNGIDEHLAEFVWRRRNADRLWDAFIDAMRDIHYDID
jgi:hypothetical protein